MSHIGYCYITRTAVTTTAKYDLQMRGNNGNVQVLNCVSVIILGDGGYRGTGYVMTHQLFKLYSLHTHTDLHIFNQYNAIDTSLEGLQLGQLMSHHISRTAVATVTKYDL